MGEENRERELGATVFINFSTIIKCVYYCAKIFLKRLTANHRKKTLMASKHGGGEAAALMRFNIQ